MRKYGIAILSIVILATACKDKTLILTSPPLSDYFPLKIGKSIIYRLDSTVTSNFGVELNVIHSYRIKDSIDAQIVDGLGRKSYRILRMYTDTNGVAPYVPMTTLQAIPNGTDWIEYVDNNLRFMKLHFPIQEGFSWLGNSFIDIDTRPPLYQDISYYDNWHYTYMNVGKPDTVLGKIFLNTITILQHSYELSPKGPFNGLIQEGNYSIEVYAERIGLIYKEFLHFNHNFDSAHPTPYYLDGSYGIKMQIISYN